MVIEADRNGVVREVMVIVAALSIVDPRERPKDKQQAAAEKHARFATPESDFLAYLNLWTYLREQQRTSSGNQFPQTVPGRVPELPAGARVAGHLQPAAPDGHRAGHRSAAGA